MLFDFQKFEPDESLGLLIDAFEQKYRKSEKTNKPLCESISFEELSGMDKPATNGKPAPKKPGLSNDMGRKK